MKQTKVMMFLAFIFCISFSMSSFAAAEATINTSKAINKQKIMSQKDFRKQFRKQWKKVKTKFKEIKKTLNDKKSIQS